MHDQSHIRDKRQTKERKIEGSYSIIFLQLIKSSFNAPDKNSSLTGKTINYMYPFQNLKVKLFTF